MDDLAVRRAQRPAAPEPPGDWRSVHVDEDSFGDGYGIALRPPDGREPFWLFIPAWAADQVAEVVRGPQATA